MSKEIDWGGAINPVGTIISYLGNNAPDGYLKCDGTTYNILDYPNLANHFENEFGSKNKFGGDGTTTFKVPNLQGEFLRCTGTNPNTDGGNGAGVGVHQGGSTAAYSYSDANWLNCGQFNGNGETNADKTFTKTTVNVGNVRLNRADWRQPFDRYIVRPTNTAVWYCIKF